MFAPDNDLILILYFNLRFSVESMVKMVVVNKGQCSLHQKIYGKNEISNNLIGSLFWAIIYIQASINISVERLPVV